jgi:membrane-bound serine protease (ClpP class)
MLVFLLGVLLVLSELLLFPGVIVPAVVGLLLMFLSLVWGMADIWPDEPFVISGELFRKPLIDLGLGMLVSIAIALALIRFLPSGWFWQHVAIQQAVVGSAQASGGAPAAAGGLHALIGQTGTVTTDLFPSGQIEIAGRRYEARTGVQSIPRGTTIIVTGCTDFGLMVERKSS